MDRKDKIIKKDEWRREGGKYKFEAFTIGIRFKYGMVYRTPKNFGR